MSTTTTYPIMTFVNKDDIAKDISISTYAYGYDYPTKLTTVPPKGELKIAVNPKTEIPQYLWHHPPIEGKASFLIDPDMKSVYV